MRVSLKDLRSRYQRATAPQEDQARTGLSLIQLLFALVVGLVFQQALVRHRDIPPAGWTHLGVAMVTVVLSWIGYHNTRQRTLWMMKFFNAPFFQYLVDFLIICTYWLLVVSAEGFLFASDADPAGNPSAVPEAALLVVVFVLYLMWDGLEISINTNERYTKCVKESDTKKFKDDHHGDRGRGRGTLSFLLIFAALALLLQILNVQTSGVVIVLDMILVAILVLFRLVQSVAAAPDVADCDPETSSEEIRREN